MEYLKEYNISEQEIKDLKNKYNDGIINFLSTEKDFLIEKLEYLKEKGFVIFPIISNNIKIFLEEIEPLKRKVKKLEEKGYSKKAIQMVLIDENLYNQV